VKPILDLCRKPAEVSISIVESIGRKGRAGDVSDDLACDLNRRDQFADALSTGPSDRHSIARWIDFYWTALTSKHAVKLAVWGTTEVGWTPCYRNCRKIGVKQRQPPPLRLGIGLQVRRVQKFAEREEAANRGKSLRHAKIPGSVSFRRQCQSGVSSTPVRPSAVRKCPLILAQCTEEAGHMLSKCYLEMLGNRYFTLLRVGQHPLQHHHR
jgi:hypothetical protein